jgi:hypothetical protein
MPAPTQGAVPFVWTPPGQITVSGLIPSGDCDGPKRGMLLNNAGPLIEDPGI